MSKLEKGSNQYEIHRNEEYISILNDPIKDNGWVTNNTISDLISKVNCDYCDKTSIDNRPDTDPWALAILIVSTIGMRTRLSESLKSVYPEFPGNVKTVQFVKNWIIDVYNNLDKFINFQKFSK